MKPVAPILCEIAEDRRDHRSEVYAEVILPGFWPRTLVQRGASSASAAARTVSRSRKKTFRWYRAVGDQFVEGSGHRWAFCRSHLNLTELFEYTCKGAYATAALRPNYRSSNKRLKKRSSNIKSEDWITVFLPIEGSFVRSVLPKVLFLRSAKPR